MEDVWHVNLTCRGHPHVPGTYLVCIKVYPTNVLRGGLTHNFWCIQYCTGGWGGGFVTLLFKQFTLWLCFIVLSVVRQKREKDAAVFSELHRALQGQVCV